MLPGNHFIKSLHTLFSVSISTNTVGLMSASPMDRSYFLDPLPDVHFNNNRIPGGHLFTSPLKVRLQLSQRAVDKMAAVAINPFRPAPGRSFVGAGPGTQVGSGVGSKTGSMFGINWGTGTGTGTGPGAKLDPLVKLKVPSCFVIAQVVFSDGSTPMVPVHSATPRLDVMMPVPPVCVLDVTLAPPNTLHLTLGRVMPLSSDHTGRSFRLVIIVGEVSLAASNPFWVLSKEPAVPAPVHIKTPRVGMNTPDRMRLFEVIHRHLGQEGWPAMGTLQTAPTGGSDASAPSKTTVSVPEPEPVSVAKAAPKLDVATSPPCTVSKGTSVPTAGAPCGPSVARSPVARPPVARPPKTGKGTLKPPSPVAGGSVVQPKTRNTRKRSRDGEPRVKDTPGRVPAPAPAPAPAPVQPQDVIVNSDSMHSEVGTTTFCGVGAAHTSASEKTLAREPAPTGTTKVASAPETVSRSVSGSVLALESKVTGFSTGQDTKHSGHLHMMVYLNPDRYFENGKALPITGAAGGTASVASQAQAQAQAQAQPRLRNNSFDAIDFSNLGDIPDLDSFPLPW